MTTQTYTSANTSVNSSKLPYIYNHIDWEYVMRKTMLTHGYASYYNPVVLDFGCGKYTAHIWDFVTSKGFNWIGYDPYNGHECVENMWELFFSPVDLIVCSNVLNVIKESEIVTEIHDLFQKKRIEQGCPYLIKVYEGNKSGIGKESKKGCWQRNESTVNYMRYNEAIVKQLITYEHDKFYVI